MTRTNVGSMLDMTKRKEEDEGEQSTVQTHCRARQLHGHYGTHVARACKRPVAMSTVWCDTSGGYNTSIV